MPKAFFCFVIFSLLNTNAAWSADTGKPPVLNGNVRRERSVKPKYNVNFEPTTKKRSSNTFQDISQSMPAAAVKENLARRNGLPSAQTSVLRPGAGAAVTSAGMTNQMRTPTASAAPPKELSPGKVTEPESSQPSNNTGFFK